MIQKNNKTTEIAYAVLTLGSSGLWGFVSSWILYFYIPPTGTPLVPIALYGLIMLLSKLINIFVNMPIGFLSDQTRTPWGRRLPYIFWATLFMAGLFILLWTPPHGNPMFTLIYLAVVMCLFNIAYGFREIPYEALLPELAPEEEQRISISGWRAGFQLAGAICAGFAGPLIEALGYSHSALIFALCMLPFFFIPLFFIREKKQGSAKVEERLSFMSHLRLTISNRSFRVFVLTWSLAWMASTFVLETIPFITTEICRGSEADTVYLYFSAIVVSLICFPGVTWLANRYGKHLVFRGSLLAGALVMPCLFVISPSVPAPLLVQGVIWICFEAMALSGFQVLPMAILAEISDKDAKLTGHNREGSYYGALGVMEQVSSGGASALLPLFLLLGRSHDDPNGPLGIRVLGFAGGLAMLIAFILYRSYVHDSKSNGT